MVLTGDQKVFIFSVPLPTVNSVVQTSLQIQNMLLSQWGGGGSGGDFHILTSQSHEMSRRGGMASHPSRSGRPLLVASPPAGPPTEQGEERLGVLVLGIPDLVTALSQLIPEVKRP